MSTVHCDSAATRWIVFNNLRLIGLQRSYAERERDGVSLWRREHPKVKKISHDLLRLEVIEKSGKVL